MTSFAAPKNFVKAVTVHDRCVVFKNTKTHSIVLLEIETEILTPGLNKKSQKEYEKEFFYY